MNRNRNYKELNVNFGTGPINRIVITEERINKLKNVPGGISLNIEGEKIEKANGQGLRSLLNSIRGQSYL